jgi:hypothetical protein
MLGHQLARSSRLLMGDLVNAWMGPGTGNESGADLPYCSPRIGSPGPRETKAHRSVRGVAEGG